MTEHFATASWAVRFPRAKQRFPYLQRRLAPCPVRDKDGFIAYLAQSHHLTLTEAREEADDFLFWESLHAELEVDFEADLI
ncbi:hypothetical protein [Phycobacter sp. K97]|jgi:hypothetical protein|uniref:hypothetical protein n=1 Tax=Phycobacter sedimenti TaxID=3133977 RepID=UPI00311F6837